MEGRGGPSDSLTGVFFELGPFHRFDLSTRALVMGAVPLGPTGIAEPAALSGSSAVRVRSECARMAREGADLLCLGRALADPGSRPADDGHDGHDALAEVLAAVANETGLPVAVEGVRPGEMAAVLEAGAALIAPVGDVDWVTTAALLARYRAAIVLRGADDGGDRPGVALSRVADALAAGVAPASLLLRLPADAGGVSRLDGCAAAAGSGLPVLVVAEPVGGSVGSGSGARFEGGAAGIPAACSGAPPSGGQPGAAHRDDLHRDDRQRDDVLRDDLLARAAVAVSAGARVVQCREVAGVRRVVDVLAAVLAARAGGPWDPAGPSPTSPGGSASS